MSFCDEDEDPGGDLFDILTQDLYIPPPDSLPEVDQLFSQAPSPLDFDVLRESPLEPADSELASSTTRFGPPVSSTDISALHESAVPLNTKKNTTWAVGVWNDWSAFRNSRDPKDVPPCLLTIQTSELNDWLCKFVMEVRRKDGNFYPPNTLHQLCCGILRYLRQVKPSLDFFKNPEFATFRKTLDAQMKRLKRTPGVKIAPKKAEPIAEAEEEILWGKGLLGTHSPQVLIDTMVFMAGLYFALRSGDEHRRLRFSSVRLIEKPGSLPCLIYTETGSKNNPGGLKHRKVSPKQVTHHANTERPDRCFIRIYKEYCSHRPEEVTGDVFYLAPLSKPRGNVWYKNQPIGVHTLSSTVKRLCDSAGVTGYKTNHSLRVTAATRLFQSGVDEQLIMQKTGHRSTDGVRAYKHSSEQQKEELSKVLNREKGVLLPPAVFSANISADISEKENRPSANAPSANVPSISLSGCSGITINISK